MYKRQLLATTDMRALFKGVLREHLEVGSDALARSVFPDLSLIHI